MKHDKEKLKNQLAEDSNTVTGSMEVEAISKLLTILEKEDKELNVSANFSDSIIQKLVQKQARENRFGWFGYIAGIIGLIAALLISLSLVEFSFELGFLKHISSYSGLFLFGIAFIVMLNILEKRIIRFSSK